MTTVFHVAQVALPGYLLHEVVAGPTVERFRACSLITSSVWSRGFEATPMDERELWCQLYIRELQRRGYRPTPDPLTAKQPPRLTIRARTAPDQTPRRNA